MTTTVVAPLRPVGRPCSICSSPNRVEIESTIASGISSLRAIARHHSLSHDAVRRHLRGHVGPALREAASAVAGLGALSIVESLREVAQVATDVRREAEESGPRRDLLLALQVEGRAWTVMADRIGIDPRSHHLAHEDALALVDAVAQASANDPERTGHALVDALIQLDRPDLAEVLGSYIATRRALAS